MEPLTSRPLAMGRVKSLAAQQRTGGRVRAWVLDAEGNPCALDDSPITRGIKGAVVQLETHNIASIAQSSSPALKVRTISHVAGLHPCYGDFISAFLGAAGLVIRNSLTSDLLTLTALYTILLGHRIYPDALLMYRRFLLCQKC